MDFPDKSFSDMELIAAANKLKTDILFDFKDKLFEKNPQWTDEYLQKIPHPLDFQVREILSALASDNADDRFYLFQKIDLVSKLWILIIKKSIGCLRFFDEREPFIKYPNKTPKAYGIDELNDYFNEYKDFEDMLYGSNKYYRDHVVHVVRVWLMGIILLLENDGIYIDNIKIEEPKSSNPINKLEKLSIWSLIALTHDLGYPLEKSQKIISKTHGMMKTFVSNPNISMDLSFSGVQNSMNDFVLRFMSSKMVFISKKEELKSENDQDTPKPESDQNAPKPYTARLQPKFYFKFQKSLEKYSHGIISAIINYKLLTYFLESDFNINEDYYFNAEEARQFYIRREILRSIADHTCADIYHMSILSLAFLLILTDECQEWGRKRIDELYIPSKQAYFLDGIHLENLQCETSECRINEQYEIIGQNENNLKSSLRQLVRQGDYFVTIFRDGQDTKKRRFDFYKNSTIRLINPKGNDDYIDYNVELVVSKDSYSTFTVKMRKDSYISGESGPCKASTIQKMLTSDDMKYSADDCQTKGDDMCVLTF